MQNQAATRINLRARWDDEVKYYSYLFEVDSASSINVSRLRACAALG